MGNSGRHSWAGSASVSMHKGPQASRNSIGAFPPRTSVTQVPALSITGGTLPSPRHARSPSARAMAVMPQRPNCIMMEHDEVEDTWEQGKGNALNADTSYKGVQYRKLTDSDQ